MTPILEWRDGSLALMSGNRKPVKLESAPEMTSAGGEPCRAAGLPGFAPGFHHSTFARIWNASWNRNSRTGGYLMTVRSRGLLFVLVLTVVCGAPSSAFAYVGPGSGLSAIGAAFALVAGVFLAILGFIWYPIKRLLLSVRRRRSASSNSAAANSTAS
jgi:hypothetical protein